MNTNGVYLCKPKGDIVAALNVDVDSVSLTQAVSDLWTLNFSIHRYVYEKRWDENPYYHSLSEMMELYLVSDDVNARFVIDAEPEISSDGTEEIKTVTAHSIECELQHKFLENFQINTGQDVSQENLVKGGLLRNSDATTGELYDYNLNPYTNLPVDYITVCCRLGEELQEFRDNLTPTSIKWQFGGDDEVTTIPITFDEETGEISGDREVLTKWYAEFTSKFPRVNSDIVWGYDKLIHNGEKSPNYDSIVCVTETYLCTKTELDGITRLYIPAPTYIFTLNESETAYEITYNEEHTFSFNRLYEGLDTVIAFYNHYGNQLSLLSLILEQAKATDWSVGKVPENIAKKKFTFTVDKQDIYSFLMNDLSHAMKVIIDFDRVAKKVSIIDLSLDDSEFETGVVTGFHNLLQSVDISSGSADGIKTVFKPTGGNDLGITYVNFGSDKIINLDYFIGKVDKYGDYQYGTEELHEKYLAYKRFRNEDLVSYNIPSYDLNINTKTIETTTTPFSGTRKQLYIELSRAYNQTLKDISELTYLVPSDGAMTDFTTFPLKDLKLVYTAYLNAFNALVELYKTEFNKTEVVESEIIQTYFYQDYKLYKDAILPNVKNAMRIYALTNSNGDFLDKDGYVTTTIEDFVYPDTGNPQYNGNAEIVTENKVDAFLYDMTLFGLSELNVKKKAWATAASLIFKDAFVKSGTPGTDAEYRTWDDIIADDMVTGFTSQAAYEKQLGQYLDYMSTEERHNSLTKTDSVGVILLANTEIAKCEDIINSLNDILSDINDKRTALANEVTYEGWGNFTEKELSILYSLMHEADYSNENILTTNLDDIVTTVAVEEELLEDAEKRLFEKSRPQYAFNTSLDNLFAIDEFAPFKDHVKLLNYFYLRYGLYDDETFKLRIVEITRNPLIKTMEMSLGFSNMTYTFEGLNDFYYLFGDQDNDSSSSGGGSSSRSGGGTYGTNDAEIEISNNMLNALLKNANTANSLNIDNLLTTKEIENLIVQGDLTINGKAITNFIKSRNYSGSLSYPFDSDSGSILDLEEGSFSFGAGKLVFGNSTLTIEGDIVAGSIGNEDGSTYINLDDGKFHFGTDKLTYDGSTLKLKGAISSSTITSSTMSSSTIIAGIIKNENSNSPKSQIDLNNNKFFFKNSSGTEVLSFNNSTLTIRGDIVAGSIGNSSGSTYINLEDGSFKFGTNKLTYDTTNGLKIQGAISGSSYSGGTISGTTMSSSTIVAGIIKSENSSNPKSQINLNGNSFYFSDGTTKAIEYSSGNLTLRGNLVAGSIGNSSGSTYINLTDGFLKFGTDKLTYDATNGLKVKGTISGSTISGSTISGGTISGTTISGTNISGGNITGVNITGAHITGDNIIGIAKGTSVWTAGNHQFDILYAGIVLIFNRTIWDTGAIEDTVEEWFVVNWAGGGISAVQLHDSGRITASIGFVKKNDDGTYRINVWTEQICGIWVYSLA